MISLNENANANANEEPYSSRVGSRNQGGEGSRLKISLIFSQQGPKSFPQKTDRNISFRSQGYSKDMEQRS